MHFNGTFIGLGGGGFTMEMENPLLDEYPLEATGKENPKVCFVPTASGDEEEYIKRFYHAFNRYSCQTSDLQLFHIRDTNIEKHLLEQDLIYVGGGSTANLLALWRLHGIPKIIQRAMENGTVVCGISAGMNCWFSQSISNSLGNPFKPHYDGFGLLPYGSCPHYNNMDTGVAKTTDDAVREGRLVNTYGVDNSAAIMFKNGVFVEAVSSVKTSYAYYIANEEGVFSKTRLPTRYLG